MYIDVWNRNEIFRNLKSVQGSMPDYNDQTSLSRLACIVNFCRNLGDMSEIIYVCHFIVMYVDVWNRSEIFRNLKSLQALMPDYNGQT